MVGAGVGTGVGWRVGAGVGWRVGAGVGTGVGWTVGAGVGTGVGGTVGAGVGTGVGGMVGAGVGTGVGGMVGAGVGGRVSVKPLKSYVSRSQQPVYFLSIKLFSPWFLPTRLPLTSMKVLGVSSHIPEISNSNSPRQGFPPLKIGSLAGYFRSISSNLPLSSVNTDLVGL